MRTYEMGIGKFDKQTNIFPWTVTDKSNGKIIKHGYSDSLNDAQDRMCFIVCCRTAQELGCELPDRNEFFASNKYQNQFMKELGIYEIYC